jgi:hypothetical protein
MQSMACTDDWWRVSHQEKQHSMGSECLENPSWTALSPLISRHLMNSLLHKNPLYDSHLFSQGHASIRHVYQWHGRVVTPV